MNWEYHNPKFEYEEIFEDLSWPWVGHRYFAYDLIVSLKPKIIVELGTYYGTSLWSFSQAIKDKQIDTEISAIDTWKGEQHSGFYGEEVFETVSDIKNKFYPKLKINLIRKTFDEAVSMFRDNSIDILHIDGLHTYEAVKHDFENWLPKVKFNGIILLHDIKVSENNFGVYKFWEELKRKYQTIEFFQSFGLGVVFLSKNVSENFKVMEKELQMHYSYSYEVNKNELIIRKDKKINELINLKTIVQQKDREVANLGHIVGQKDQQINALYNSTSWKITEPLRFMAENIKKYIRLPKKAIFIIHRDGFVLFVNKFFKKTPKSRQFQMNDKLYLSDLFVKSYEKSPQYITYDEHQYDFSKNYIKLIAFYFPQYHPFPENEKFWGKGFTEWTNVTKAVPIFKDHYQPRLPGELGFYDTRIKDVLKEQIRIAKNYGIYGFCFHHYWFSGKPVMRVPYNMMMANPDLDIPFCLHWANEPWTVRWDGAAGKAGEMLLAQDHTPEDDLAFIKDIEPALKDKRYIRIEGRPLLIVYRPGLFPDIKATIKRWNDYCESVGIGKLYLVLMHTNFDGRVDPKNFGFDAAIEYPPHIMRTHDIKHSIDLFPREFSGNIYSYDEMVKNSTELRKPDYTLFRGLLPDWDCTPRRNNPDIYIGSTPLKYQGWLSDQIEYTKKNLPANKQLIFINAWNEWAEGAYLEPDRKFGYAYLNATLDALEYDNKKIAVVGHMYHDELAEEFLEYFKNIPAVFDIYISTHSKAKDKLEILFSKEFSPNRVHVVAVENRGRDMAPFLLTFKEIYPRYDLVCWVHSKKSTSYNPHLSGWRKHLLDNLLGSKDVIRNILSAFKGDEKLGMIVPEYFPPVADQVEWGSNFENAKKLCEKMGIRINKNDRIEYPAGSMFWFRPKALKSLFDLDIKINDFEKNSEKMTDGTLAHAIERVFLKVVEKNQYSWSKVLYKPFVQDKFRDKTKVVDYNLILKKPRRIAVILHLFYADLAPEFVSYLKNLFFSYDLFITTTKEHEHEIKSIFSNALGGINISITVLENQGFDIWPFISILQNIHQNYDYICKIHGKKSLPAHPKWRNYVLDNLIGSGEVIKQIITQFEEDINIGVVYPETFVNLAEYNKEDSWRENWDICNKLATKMGINIKRNINVDFPSGSMFWFRPNALLPLVKLHLTSNDFNYSNDKKNGTPAHAIERLFCLIANKEGYGTKKVLFDRE